MTNLKIGTSQPNYIQPSDKGDLNPQSGLMSRPVSWILRQFESDDRSTRIKAGFLATAIVVIGVAIPIFGWAGLVLGAKEIHNQSKNKINQLDKNPINLQTEKFLDTKKELSVVSQVNKEGIILDKATAKPNNNEILKLYEFPNSTLNIRHQNSYGSKQEFYQTKMKEMVAGLVDQMQDSNSINFRELLTNSGIFRNSIAKESGTSDPIWFGREKMGVRPAYTIVSDSFFGSYIDKFDKVKHREFVKFKIDSKEIILTQYVYQYNWETKDYTRAFNHVHNTFWMDDDPMFKYTESLFKKIATNNYPSGEDLRKDIAEFHWLYANIVPFFRGTASIGEAITDAMWLHHGYLPERIKEGSIDLEALTTPDIENFIPLYPMGKKVDV